MRWYLIARQYYNENTPEYGMGDYPEHIPYIAAVVEAETKRKAQNACKKIFPSVKFGGRFSPDLWSEKDEYLATYLKPADPRLSADAKERHNSGLRHADATS